MSFSLLVFSHSLAHSGAEGLRVCRFNRPDRWWQWNCGGHLHRWAGSAPCRGVLGVQPLWPIRGAAIGRGQRHHQHTSALPLAAHAPRPRPRAHLCGSPPSSAAGLQDPLPAQCAVWVSEAFVRYVDPYWFCPAVSFYFMFDTWLVIRVSGFIGTFIRLNDVQSRLRSKPSCQLMRTNTSALSFLFLNNYILYLAKKIQSQKWRFWFPTAGNW